MADVQIQQPGERSSSSGAVWAIVVIVLLAIIAWFVFAGPMGGGDDVDVDADINVPGATNPPAGGGTTPTQGGIRRTSSSPCLYTWRRPGHHSR